MKRLATAWVVAALLLMGLSTLRSDIELGAQETTTSAIEPLLTQIADAQRNEDALHAELAAAWETERAEMAATMGALEDQVAAAEATSADRATEVAALQTQVAELEAGQVGSTAPTTLVEVGMNEVAQAGPWEVTVTGIERGNLIEGRAGSEPAVAQGVFLLVELEIVNAGTEAQKYDPTWFRITDDRGRSWPFDFLQTDGLALAGVGARQFQAIQPGLPTTAVVVFDIAADATGLTFGTREDLGGTSEPQPDPFVVSLEE